MLTAGEAIGRFDPCKRVVLSVHFRMLILYHSVCQLKPCSFDVAYQPSLPDVFPTGKILLPSYFDRLLYSLDSLTTEILVFRSLPFHSLQKQVCSGPMSWKEHWGSDPAVMEELEGRSEWCLDLSFMHALLVLGYEFSET